MKPPKVFSLSHFEQRGTILVVACWVVAVMALLSLSVGTMARQYLRAVRTLDAREELRLIAEAGVRKAIAVINSTPRGSPLPDSLRSRWSSSDTDFRAVTVGNGQFTVSDDPEAVNPPKEKRLEKEGRLRYGVVDEESKIPLNHMNSQAILEKIFGLAANVDYKTAASIAESVIDWRDADDHATETGAENRYYQTNKPAYRPKNGPFGSLEELMLVRGVTPAIFSKVSPYLSLYGSGQINLNTASPVVLSAIGFPDSLVDKIKEFRKGRDLKESTSDDGAFKAVQSAPNELELFRGLSGRDKALLVHFAEAGLLAVQSSNFLIRSTSYYKGRTERMVIQCVYERHGRIRAWSERYETGEPPADKPDGPAK
jgi:general secretion pathway protein K